MCHMSNKFTWHNITQHRLSRYILHHMPCRFDTDLNNTGSRWGRVRRWNHNHLNLIHPGYIQIVMISLIGSKFLILKESFTLLKPVINVVVALRTDNQHDTEVVIVIISLLWNVSQRLITKMLLYGWPNKLKYSWLTRGLNHSQCHK